MARENDRRSIESAQPVSGGVLPALTKESRDNSETLNGLCFHFLASEQPLHAPKTEVCFRTGVKSQTKSKGAEYHLSRSPKSLKGLLRGILGVLTIAHLSACYQGRFGVTES